VVEIVAAASEEQMYSWRKPTSGSLRQPREERDERSGARRLRWDSYAEGQHQERRKSRRRMIVTEEKRAETK